MEEQRAAGIVWFRIRLLRRLCAAAVQLLLAVPFFPHELADGVPAAGGRSALAFFPAGEKIYSGTEFVLALDVPAVPPDEVSVALPPLPDGVAFVSLQQERRAKAGGGTSVLLRLRCSEAGAVHLPSIPVRISGAVHDVPVPPLEVWKNFEEALPEMVVTLPDGREFSASGSVDAPVLAVAAGTPVAFTVSVRYAARLLAFSWTAPRNALLEETERHEPAEMYAASDEAVPVAEFSWVPLEAGVQLFPEMRLEAVSFGGIRADAAMPEISVSVSSGNAAAGAEVGAADVAGGAADVFSGAFLRQERPEPAGAAAGASLEECVRLAGLRRAERKSLPFGGARRKRAELERGLGLSEGPAEPTVFVFVLFLALSAAFLLAAAAALARRRSVWLCAGVAAALAACAAVSGVRLREPHGIFCGGTIGAVPEPGAAASALVEPGRCVRIVRRAGGWVFVRAGSSSGWTAADRILEI